MTRRSNAIQPRKQLGQRPRGEEVLSVSKKQKEGQCGCSRMDGAWQGRAEVRELPRGQVRRDS